MPTERVECPVCGHWVTKSRTGTLQMHKANPRWVGSKKLHNDPPGPWCPGGGVQNKTVTPHFTIDEEGGVTQHVELQNWYESEIQKIGETMDEVYPEEIISIKYFDKAGGVYWVMSVRSEVIATGWAVDVTAARKKAHVEGISAAVDWMGTQR